MHKPRIFTSYSLVKFSEYLIIRELMLGKRNTSKIFWDDIKEGLSTKTEHYWGTITLRAAGEYVYCKEKDIPFEIYEVVDGQQRITTMYLFLLAHQMSVNPYLGTALSNVGMYID